MYTLGRIELSAALPSTTQPTPRTSCTKTRPSPFYSLKAVQYTTSTTTLDPSLAGYLRKHAALERADNLLVRGRLCMVGLCLSPARVVLVVLRRTRRLDVGVCATLPSPRAGALSAAARCAAARC